jgi:small subunit ribosomal protein S21
MEAAERADTPQVKSPVDEMADIELQCRIPAGSGRIHLKMRHAITGQSSCQLVSNKVPGVNVVKLTLRDRESAQEAVRRFRKLVERSGIKKEMRVREFYEKPSETKRRARLRAQRRARRERFFATH